MILLDTNVVSELMQRRPDTSVLAWLRRHKRADLWTSSITAAEILYGVERLPRGARRIALRKAADATLTVQFAERVAAFDRVAAEHYAVLAARLRAEGRARPLADLQIAGICLSRGAALATRNTRDFADTGVRLIDPWSADAV